MRRQTISTLPQNLRLKYKHSYPDRQIRKLLLKRVLRLSREIVKRKTLNENLLCDSLSMAMAGRGTWRSP
jgi:hypothetical protein